MIHILKLKFLKLKTNYPEFYGQPQHPRKKRYSQEMIEELPVQTPEKNERYPLDDII